MLETTTFEPKDANPPAVRPNQIESYWLRENGKLSLVTLKYHVWTVKGIPHDAFEVLGTTQTYSYEQKQSFVKRGVLTPVNSFLPVAEITLTDLLLAD